MAFFGGDHEGFHEGETVVEVFRQAQQHLGLHAVDLVDGQRHGAAFADAFQPGENLLHAIGDAAMRLDQQDDDIGIGRTAPGRRDHRAVKPAFGREKAGRIHKDDLGVAFHRDTADAGAGGLHLVGDDRDLGPHHPVEKRRFPCVRLADEGHKTCACHALSNLSSRALAAACSACRLEPAVAASASPFSSWADIVNTGA